MTTSGTRELLASLQLADSAFPSGFYTLSHGLEGFAQAKAVTPDSLPDLLTDLLRHGVGPSDATALAHAHRAASAGDTDRLVAVEQRLFASKLSREQRVASTRTGRQLLDLTREVYGGAALDAYARLLAERRVPGCQAVVAGIAYAAAGVGVERAVASDLFAVAASFVGAALRLRLTDHRVAQVLLHRTGPVIEEVAADALVRDLADLGGCVPMVDVMAGRHERAEARLFAT